VDVLIPAFVVVVVVAVVVGGVVVVVVVSSLLFSFVYLLIKQRVISKLVKRN